MATEYIPFEKALKDLKMSEDELKRLVSEDEIQAVKRGSKIRLRKSDVEALKRKQEEVKEEAEEEVEELEFADEDLDGDDAGMVTAVLEDDSLLEEEETLDLSPEELEGEEPRQDVSQRASGQRASGQRASGQRDSGRRGPRAVPVRSRGRAAAIRQQGSDEESTLMRVLVIATSVFLVYSFLVAHSIVQGQVTGATRWLADMFK
ncbi:MAG: helix-turn-helix domain-containing protein [Planctomycetota bacterium]